MGWFCYKLQNLLAIHQSLILNASALSKHLFVFLLSDKWSDSHSIESELSGILQVKIWEWAAVPFSRGFSQSRDETQVSCIAGGFLPAELPGKLSLIIGF